MANFKLQSDKNAFLEVNYNKSFLHTEELKKLDVK